MLLIILQSEGNHVKNLVELRGLSLSCEGNHIKNLVEKKWHMSHSRMSKHLKSSSVRCSLTVKCWTPLYSSLNLRSHFCFSKKCEFHKIRLINGWLIVNKTWLLDIRLQRVRAFGSRFTAQIGVLITYKISFALVAQRISADRYER